MPSLKLPIIEVDFDTYLPGQFFPGNDQPEDMRLLDPVGKLSPLAVRWPRIADAILRDNMHGVMFRQSDVGRAINRVSDQNATPLFELCPTALLFGM